MRLDGLLYLLSSDHILNQIARFLFILGDFDTSDTSFQASLRSFIYMAKNQIVMAPELFYNVLIDRVEGTYVFLEEMAKLVCFWKDQSLMRLYGSDIDESSLVDLEQPLNDLWQQYES